MSKLSSTIETDQVPFASLQEMLEEVTIAKWKFKLVGIAYGNGRLPLQVIYSESNREPSPIELRSAWKTRQDGQGFPLLVVVHFSARAYVCGPIGDDPTVYPDLDPGQVERICLEALEQESRQAALRSLRDSLGSLEQEGLPGLRNEGFLANHELIHGVPNRTDWNTAGSKGKNALTNTGKELLTSLGFTIDALDSTTDVLRSGELKTAIAVLLTERESPEAGSERFPGSQSPVSYALIRADEENLDWVVLLHGRKIRLYPVKMGVGVGRRGRTETYIECHTGLIPDDQAAFLWLLFSAEALVHDGTLESILKNSMDFAGDLANQLRERIYEQVIPRLSEGLAIARRLTNPTADELTETYQMAMRVLFRILFIAYGEDKDLLPYHINDRYKQRSLKTKAKELLEIAEDQFDDSDSWWVEVKDIFKAVDKGNRAWGVPAYNGGLFTSDASESTIGAALDKVSLPNNIFGPALQYLLLVPTDEGVLGPVDFRSLGVREFGTIYEGLLESELSLAETDLTIESKGKSKDIYRPCKKGEEVIIPKGRIYLHNSSGARKSTGSYYTKSFAVEHLLDRALEPALDDHFARLDELEELEAAESFFDFRVADIAMGSGHFLVAAVDRIEVRFSAYLLKRPLPYVTKELQHLRNAATEALGDAADLYEFEDNTLLRRQIARRCIYGVDINEVAVQLARLALWIHTFVPGLPLSLLDRTLIHGNSLIGIGQLDEVTKELTENKLHGWIGDLEPWLEKAKEPLARLGKLADSSKAEIDSAREIWNETQKAVAPLAALCKVVTHRRIKGKVPFEHPSRDWKDNPELLLETPEFEEASKDLAAMNDLHFPVAFPEVFLRDRAGFDVILGNPPWEEATVEEDAFWARYFPGLRGLSQREQEALKVKLRKTRPDLVSVFEQEKMDAELIRAALVRGPFPGMGTGDPDFYKAFCWRFWFLATRFNGRIGVVLPRSVLAAKGSEEFRWRVFRECGNLDATLINNTGQWFFEDIDPRYTIGLISISRTNSIEAKGIVSLSGPYNSKSNFDARIQNQVASFPVAEVHRWNDSASLPLLPTEGSMSVFAQLRKAPRLDHDEPGEWRARPYSELHATNDKKDKKTGQILMDLESETCPEGFFPVYKGKSFDLWEPDRGVYYAWADPSVMKPRLQAKRERGSRTSSSVFSECDQKWCSDIDTLPCNFARVAFRDVTRATDTRTVRCALVPPNIFITNKGPYLVFTRGKTADVAFLLGILSSLSLDWYARRFVEISMNFFIFNPFPIPRPEETNILRTRVIELAGRLACPDERFADWAKEVGVEYGPLEEEIKQDMIHELDAIVAHLYELTEEHLIHIFETFHVGWDYHERLDATMKHFQSWSEEA